MELNCDESIHPLLNLFLEAEKNLMLEKENQSMGQKFKQILAQYEEREKQMDRINKQMEVTGHLIGFLFKSF